MIRTKTIDGERKFFVGMLAPRLDHPNNYHTLEEIRAAVEEAGATIEGRDSFGAIAKRTYAEKPKPEGGWFDEFVAGRYLDRMRKKDGEWRIQHRIVAFEWFRHLPDSSEFDDSPFGSAQRGARLPDDPMYRLFAGLL